MSATPRTDAIDAANHIYRMGEYQDLARTLEREAAMLKEGMLARMSLISSQEATIATMRAALADAEFLMRKAGQIAGPMQDSFNRSAADARAALVQS